MEADGFWSADRSLSWSADVFWFNFDCIEFWNCIYNSVWILVKSFRISDTVINRCFAASALFVAVLEFSEPSVLACCDSTTEILELNNQVYFVVANPKLVSLCY